MHEGTIKRPRANHFAEMQCTAANRFWCRHTRGAQHVHSASPIHPILIKDVAPCVTKLEAVETNLHKSVCNCAELTIF